MLNGSAGISPEMALRLEKWLGTNQGGRADVWLAQQAAYDLWQARKVTKARLAKVNRIKATAGNAKCALSF